MIYSIILLIVSNDLSFQTVNIQQLLLRKYLSENIDTNNLLI